MNNEIDVAMREVRSTTRTTTTATADADETHLMAILEDSAEDDVFGQVDVRVRFDAGQLELESPGVVLVR